MAPPRRPKRDHFIMEPAFTPEPTGEQKPTFDVYAVLRDHLKYVGLIHNELHRQRRSQQELEMKVTELSSKVDTLISVAKDLKGRVDAAGNGSGTGAPVMGGGAPQEDDPEVQRLADRIDDALRVLRGEVNVPDAGVPANDPAGNATTPPANQFDPNSPVPSAPSQEALATDINYTDPNAR